MKKVVLLMGLALSMIASKAQENQTKDKAEFGFSLGFNRTDLFPTRDQISQNQSYLTPVHQSEHGYGFSLGVLMEKRLSNYFIFYPKMDLSFNGGQFETLYPDGHRELTRISPVTVEFAPLISIRPESDKLMPYFMLGPNLKLPIDKDKQADIRPEFAIDFGIGLNQRMAHFNFAPELKYSYNLTNLAYQVHAENLYAHRISLVFNFKG